MEIREVDEYEYQRVIPESYVVFNSVRFNSINSLKCESVKYIIFIERVPRLGIVCGIRDNTLQSPFSAPYGGFSAVKPQTRLRYYADAAGCLNEYATTAGFNSIGITLPPCFYDETHMAKQINALFGNEFNIRWIDVDLLFNLRQSEKQYLDVLPKNARNSLRKALTSDLEFISCVNESQKKRCYEIIRMNHEAKKYPLLMSYDEIRNTTEIIPADFFIISRRSMEIAAAIIFHINNDIVQLIQWGALPEYEFFKPMNYLAYQFIPYYQNLNYKYIDFGPSSQRGNPDFGLIDFKESLGCRLSLKYRFEKVFC